MQSCSLGKRIRAGLRYILYPAWGSRRARNGSQGTATKRSRGAQESCDHWGERERGPLLWTQRTRCHDRYIRPAPATAHARRYAQT